MQLKMMLTKIVWFVSHAALHQSNNYSMLIAQLFSQRTLSMIFEDCDVTSLTCHVKSLIAIGTFL